MSVIADVHVGKADDNWPVEERVQIHFHNFADLPQQKGTVLKSSKFTCAGHEWYLWFYPRGERNAADGMVSVHLGTDLTSTIVVDFDIMLKKKTGNNFTAESVTKTEFPKPNNGGLGWNDYDSRDRILHTSNNVLNNGTLTFEVRIRPHHDYYCRHAIPKSSVTDDVYNHLYQDQDTADVAFKVKRSVFYAHKAILKARVPELAELAEPYDTKKAIPIKDVVPDIFETMLQYVYGKDISVNYWKEHAKQVLDASGKYGFTELKSTAEVWHVKNLEKKFTVDNVIDELLYADGKNCPLLKKAAMDFILDCGEDIVESESYEKLDESPQLRKEVMKAALSSKKRKRDE
eukprot:scaffold55476_cov22-Cyclotella_meneghiniana.AAC.4